MNAWVDANPTRTEAAVNFMVIYFQLVLWREETEAVVSSGGRTPVEVDAVGVLIRQ